MARKPTRRKLAGAAALVDALSSTGPFAGSAEAATESDTGKLATFDDYATQEFEAWPADAGGDLLQFSEFLPRCANDHALIVMALAVMQRDHLQNATVAAEAQHDDLCKFVEALWDMAERYEGLVNTLRAAHVRVLAGMARHLATTGEV